MTNADLSIIYRVIANSMLKFKNLYNFPLILVGIAKNFPIEMKRFFLALVKSYIDHGSHFLIGFGVAFSGRKS
jgi:hypothetical protein